MSKLAIVINGKPGVGKDTLCDAVIRHYRARKISSIDPIAAIAKQTGWDGVKDAKSRKFLSDLKRITADFNGYPNRWLLERYAEFLQSDDDILFVHIRERDQIEAFRKSAAGGCKTLLIERPGMDETMGNASDDDVDKYCYDFSYINSLPLSDTENTFLEFFSWMLEESGRGDIRPNKQ